MNHVGLYEIESIREITQRFTSHHTLLSFKQAGQSPKLRGCPGFFCLMPGTRIN